ncbi:gluconate 2-dehydrogenase subunit 3 family protein [Mucilaginibacter sp. KACC 22063]|uniref:gluconate 2-dehydrogenase subunit 3 family protein n=1 Tax=Mucilaginibacter sp. KACC 22063 TaxID=3025666 RepID=UPI002365F9F8|nr:gluconate 2-dehydrogenase subunit 3 family protein [Mucilaginibacter sp. KACC 22063]WDF54029.1 gluconate 2-dehydrogenase subunit 3 family protein [Mucilaginibacter sp. KACC 22063]
MDRRTAITNLALIIGGAALLPSCMQDHGKASIALKKISINGDQEKLLADISETIIPKTDTPGAKDLNLHLFVMKMVDDCFSPDDQKAFTNGLDRFAKDAEAKYNKPFGQCTQVQRENILNELDHKLVEQRKQDKKVNGGSSPTPPQDDVLAFYNLVKSQTIFGYTYSKYFMTKQIVYELVPGRYNPHYPVKDIKVLQHG